jgi:hypothetical protein
VLRDINELTRTIDQFKIETVGQAQAARALSLLDGISPETIQSKSHAMGAMCSWVSVLSINRPRYRRWCVQLGKCIVYQSATVSSLMCAAG